MKIVVDGESFEGATAEYVLGFYRRWNPEKKIERLLEPRGWRMEDGNVWILKKA